MVFKVGDKVKIRQEYKINDTKRFSHNVIYKVLASSMYGLTLEGIDGDDYGEMFFELVVRKSVGFVIE